MSNTDVIDTTTWETQIRSLMKQLGYSNDVDTVISKVKSTAKGNEPNDLLYDRAWNKFRSILMA